ncbi:MAG: 30S ribosomal protein S2 [Rhodothermales bacterium]
MSEAKQGTHRVSVEELLKAGTHFGHLTRRWNPKMKPFIFMERNGIHIIDLMQTQASLDRAAEAAARFSKMGRKILFIGTKKQARDTVRKHAESCDSPFTVERWLGGTLTNFQTIRKSIRRMEGIQKMQEDGTLDQLKKKERLMKSREQDKLNKVLGGISKMARLPGAVFIVDINREHIAVKEAKKLGIPIIAIVDTNCDPDVVDFAVPANDDALKSIDLITSVIAAACAEGSKSRDIEEATKKAEKEKRNLDEGGDKAPAEKKKTRKLKTKTAPKAAAKPKAAAEAKPEAAAEAAPEAAKPEAVVEAAPEAVAEAKPDEAKEA